MTACIALLAVSLASALGGALLLHLWQTRPRRITRAGYTVGERLKSADPRGWN